MTFKKKPNKARKTTTKKLTKSFRNKNKKSKIMYWSLMKIPSKTQSPEIWLFCDAEEKVRNLNDEPWRRDVDSFNL